jgi:hypothetical protein
MAFLALLPIGCPRAGCAYLPVRHAHLAVIHRDADQDPDRAIRMAKTAIGLSASSRAPFIDAQLYAILAASAIQLPSETLLSNNRSLQQRLDSERAQFEREARERRRWTLLAAVAALCCSGLVYLVWLMRRQSKSLMRAQTHLRTAASNAPDALVF